MIHSIDRIVSKKEERETLGESYTSLSSWTSSSFLLPLLHTKLINVFFLSLSCAVFFLFIPRFFQVVLNISFIVHQLTSKNEYIHTYCKQTYLDVSAEQREREKETFFLSLRIQSITQMKYSFQLIRKIISLNPN